MVDVLQLDQVIDRVKTAEQDYKRAVQERNTLAKQARAAGMSTNELADRLDLTSARVRRRASRSSPAAAGE